MTALVVPPLAIDLNWAETLTGAGFRLGVRQPFGPMGLRVIVMKGESLGSIIVSQADFDDVEWIHASLAFADRVPTYDELVALHRAMFGRRRFAFQVFAPEAKHVSIHAYALHLWGRVDGSNPMPDFGAFGTI